MKSPRNTSVEMTATNFGDVEVDVCPETGGIWLDGDELSQLSGWFKEGDAFEAAGRENQGELGHDNVESPCPRCTDLKLVAYELPCVEDYKKVTLDICPSCFGIWIDGPELLDVRTIMMKNVAANFDTKIEVQVEAPFWKRLFFPQPLRRMLGGD